MSVEINVTDQIIEVNPTAGEVNVNITEIPVVVNATDQIIEIADTGLQGPQGPSGPGVPIGGTEGQVLIKNSDTNFDTIWVDNYSESLRTICRNSTGVTIAPFKVVYINGATGNKPNIVLADADMESTSSKTFGVTAQSISNNSNGYVVVSGKLTNVNTSSFNAGDLLWLSGTPGGVVTTPPDEPAHAVFVGYVIRSHPNFGEVEIKIQNGYELDELHGVKITNPTNNQVLKYNSTTQLWENGSSGNGTVSSVNASGGTGISVSGGPITTSGTLTITNTAPDQVVALTGAGTTSISGTYPNFTITSNDQFDGTVTSVDASGGTGISVSGGPITSSGSFTITNTAPDQVVSLTGTGTTSISGTYPNFTINSDDQYDGTVTSVNLTAGTGVSVSGGPITSSGSITVTNTAPDQVVSITGGGTTSVSGTYPNFTVSSADQYVGTVTSVDASVPTGFSISGNPITSSGTLAIGFASGYSLPTNAKQTEWDTAYTNRITSLTTNNSSGAATLSSNTLNIPNYTLSGLGGVPSSRTLTVNGTGYDLSADRSWSVGTITSLTGEATASGSGAVSVTLDNASVIGKVLTGLNITGGGSIVSTDSILQAFGKVQNQISALVGSVQYEGVWNASTNSPTIVSGTGSKGDYYVVNVAGSTTIDGISDWKIGDWIIFNGTTWDKVDNTDAVSSVNGFTGAVSLSTSNIGEGTNLYFTNTRAQNAITLTTSGTSGSATYSSGTLNIPTYSLSGLGGVPTSRTLTINGTAFDLSADRSWSVGTVTSVAALTIGTTGTDVSSSVANGTTTPVITLNIPTASATNRGALSSADWTTFNSKEPAITAGTTSQYWRGDKSWQTLNTAAVTESTNLYYTDARARAAISAGTGISYNSTTGVITNSAPDQTVALTAGAGISVSGIYPSFTIASTISQYTDALARAALSFVAGSGAYNSTTGVITIPTNTNQLTNGAGFITSSSLSAYLPLAGGTLTGSLGGTSASFSSSVTANNYVASGGNNTTTYNSNSATTGWTQIAMNNTSGSALLGVEGSTAGTLCTGTNAYATILRNYTATDLQIATNNVVRQTITSGGNVGIGTTSPNVKLEVINDSATVYDASTATTNRIINIRNASSGTGYNSFINFITEPNGEWYLGAVNKSNYSDFVIVSRDASYGERVRITSAGNVGIGTTNPTARLQISNTSAGAATVGLFLNNESNTSSTEIRLAFAANTNNDISSNRYSYISALNTSGVNGQALVFATNETGNSGTERMRITSGGNVLIGTTTDNGVNRFQVSGGLRTTVDNTLSAITIVNTSSSNKQWDISPFNNDLAINESNVGTRMYFKAGGEIIVSGTTDNGAYNLQVNGTGVWGAGAYVNGSDIRLKDNIKDIDEGLSLINKIRPVSFNYKESYSKDRNVQTGFIAQELQEVFKDKDYLNGLIQEGPEHLNVAYQNIIPILVKAIQEQQVQIDNLKKQII